MLSSIGVAFTRFHSPLVGLRELHEDWRQENEGQEDGPRDFTGGNRVNGEGVARDFFCHCGGGGRGRARGGEGSKSKNEQGKKKGGYTHTPGNPSTRQDPHFTGLFFQKSRQKTRQANDNDPSGAGRPQ